MCRKSELRRTVLDELAAKGAKLIEEGFGRHRHVTFRAYGREAKFHYSSTPGSRYAECQAAAGVRRQLRKMSAVNQVRSA